MPKQASSRSGKRSPKRIWQFQDQWLGKEPGSPNFYRYFYIGDRRVGRKSLGTEDLEEAKARLVRLVLSEAPADPLSPDTVYFSAIMRYYMDNHGNFIRSKAAAQRAFDIALIYLKQATGKPSPVVADFSLARQESFMRWCRDEHELTAKSISTYLAMIRAGIGYASRPRIVRDSKGVEREARMLSAAPFIQSAEKEVVKVTGLARSTPREFVPSDAQVAAFLDATFDADDEKEVREREHLFRYAIIALNTWARPEAIFELNVWEQVDLENGLINLNTKGRAQNNKYRPTIRLTDNLRGWLLHWNMERPIVYLGKPVEDILPKTIKKVAVRAGVPQMIRYSLRHYMNTRAMRVPSDIRPDREERAVQMGHFDPRFKTTTAYEHFDPDYLVNCMKSTDAIMRALDNLSRKSLFAPNSLSNTGLVVVENKGKSAG
jgi:integrase